MRILNISYKNNNIYKFIKWGKRWKISPEAEYRLKVIGLWKHKFNENYTLTGRYCGLHRNTIKKYVKLYNPNNLYTLEPKQTIPIKKHRRKTSIEIKNKIESLKREYPYYGKQKIKILLERENIIISSSTIGRVFKERKLTYLWRKKESACNFKKTIRRRKSRKRPPKKFYATKPGQWIQIDTIKFGFAGQYVYVINAVDLFSRLAISYAYRSPSSKNARDFLYKLKQFFPDPYCIEMIQTDNGSEFLKFFDSALEKEKIKHTFSYPKSPKMNAYIESYNKTIQVEALLKIDALSSLKNLNKKISNYLIEYNSFRPHESLEYKVPLLVYLKHFLTHQKVHTELWTCSR